MRRVLLAAVVLWTLAAALPAQAEKVTSDPNASRAPVSQAEEKPDSRLAQKVTYQGGYKRLHAVAEELTKQTGVTIRAGSNSQDWRVRDIPLIVCVKDMPLGRLLRTVADTAHVTFAMEKIANAKDDKPVYKFYRPRKQQEAIDAVLNARVEANRKLAEWSWDTLVKYAAMPDASADLPAPGPNEPVEVNGMMRRPDVLIDGERVRLVAKFLASLGPDAEAKALAGEQVTVLIGKSTSARQLFDYAAKWPGPFRRGKPKEPTPADLSEALIAIKIRRQDQPDRGAGFSFYVYGFPMETQFGTTHDSWQAEPVLCAKALASIKKLKLPAAPDPATALQDAPPPGFKALKEDLDYKLPILQPKVKLPAPQPHDKQRVKALEAVSAAAGLSIVCEDFQSHKLGHYSAVRAGGTEVPVAAILKEMGRGPYGFDWFLDEKAGTLIGRAWEWRKQHESMVSESLRESIVGKCRKEGAELDDLAPLWDLTREQIREWFEDTPDLPGISTDSGSGGYGVATWRLYNMLGPEDKSLARSDAGLPIAEFDPGSLLELFRKCRDEMDNGSVLMATDDNPIDTIWRKYVSADYISKLVMKVTSTELTHWTIRPLEPGGMVGFEDYRPGPEEPKRHNWSVRLLDPTTPNADLYLGGRWDVAFPAFTPEHEAELVKKAESNAAGK